MRHNPTTRYSRIPMTCEMCGTVTMIHRYRVKAGLGRYCSAACANLGRRKPLSVKLWEKVDRSGGPDACWPFMRYRNGPYGMVGDPDRGPVYAHRLAWELTNGPVPDGLWVLHQCDNPPCCNPAHLFLGTLMDNVEDCERKGRTLFGSRNAQAKLTEEQVITIRARYASGERRAALAKEYGVGESTVQHIIEGSTWRHLLHHAASADS